MKYWMALLAVLTSVVADADDAETDRDAHASDDDE